MCLCLTIDLKNAWHCTEKKNTVHKAQAILGLLFKNSAHTQATL